MLNAFHAYLLSTCRINDRIAENTAINTVMFHVQCYALEM